MKCSTKGIDDPPLALLSAVYRQKVSIALQRDQVAFYFEVRVVASEEGSSTLTNFLKFPILSSFYNASYNWWELQKNDLF